VLAGKDVGRRGTITRVINDTDKVIVDGVNMVKRHTAPSAGNAGGIVEKEASIHVSNVAYVDPKTDKPTRVGYKTLEDGRKVRFAKRSGEIIDA
jgi:large subunit ribosomal protein L24